MTDTSAWTYRTSHHDGHVRQHLSRGDVRIVDATDDGITREQLQGIADEVWGLAQTYPPANPGTVTVTVKPPSAFLSSPDGRGYEAGNTKAFTAHMELNELTLTDLTTSSNAMPVARRVPTWTYTIAHEYGHAFTSRADVDEGDGKHVRLAFFKEWWLTTLAGGMSSYGASDPIEGYAEAFAEWSLTRGSTSNRAALSYAHRYRWAA